MRRHVLVVLVAAMLVLAGCSGQTPTETATPTDGNATTTVDETPTATPTSTPPPGADIDFPVGASADGFNVSWLAARQNEILNETTHRIEYVTVSGEGEDARRTAVLVATGGERSLTRIVGNTNFSILSDEDGTAVRMWNATRSQYSYFERNASYAGQFYRQFGRTLAPSLIKSVVRPFEFSVAGTETVDGRTVVVYEATGLNESYVSRPNTGNFTSVNLTVRMREDGLVTAADGTATVSTDEGERRESIDYEISDLGSTTVEPPAWTEEELPTLDVRVVGDGKVLAITHEGGPALTNATVRVGTNATRMTTLSLSPGETVYLTASTDSSTFEVSGTMPTPGEGVVDLSRFEPLPFRLVDDAVNVALLVGDDEGDT